MKHDLAVFFEFRDFGFRTGRAGSVPEYRQITFALATTRANSMEKLAWNLYIYIYIYTFNSPGVTPQYLRNTRMKWLVSL